MLPSLLLVALLASAPHASTACPRPDAGAGVATTDWEAELQRAIGLLVDQGRPDCAQPFASELNEALRTALNAGAVAEDRAGVVMARLGQLGTVAAEINRGWGLLQQGKPDQAQSAAESARAMVDGNGLTELIGSTRANRLHKLCSDLWTLAEDAADVRRALGAGDEEKAQQGAASLWKLTEGWCQQGRLGAPQCEAATNEAAALLGQAASRSQATVPYLFQQANRESPEVTGANTAVAMLLGSFGVQVSPDEITRSWGPRYADKPAGLAAVFNDYAVKQRLPVRLIPHTDGTMADVDRQVDAGSPTIVHGQFASVGHAVVVLSRDSNSYVVHDPGGRWTESYRGGYGYSRATDGKNARYGAAAFRSAVATRDGVTSSTVSWQELRWID